jgi:molybdopterin/thiamine biosynthesis adenylyltransferase
MPMLTFQVGLLAPEQRRAGDSSCEIPVRTIDGGDCLTTLVHPQMRPDTAILVSVRSIDTTLDLEEHGHAVDSILADVERLKAEQPRYIASEGRESRAHAAQLVVLRYASIGRHSKESWWIVQRQLRHKGFDICTSDGGVIVGFSEAGTGDTNDRLEVHLVGPSEDMADRDGSLIDRRALQRKAALIVGLGSVGSVLACELARSGVGRFIIGDSERLEWGNVVRHAAGLSDVGRRKTRIVRDLIRDRNPTAEVTEIPSDVSSESIDAYENAVAEADVVLCATDTRTSRLICNRLCVRHAKKVIFGGLTAGAYAGAVFQFRPPDTMCYHCFVTAFPEAAADRETSELDYGGGPDGHLALDISPITNLMAKLALIELQRHLGTVACAMDERLNAPWYIWVNRPEAEYEADPPVLQWHPVRMEKVAECPHCGSGGVKRGVSCREASE